MTGDCPHLDATLGIPGGFLQPTSEKGVKSYKLPHRDNALPTLSLPCHLKLMNLARYSILDYATSIGKGQVIDPKKLKMCETSFSLLHNFSEF